MNDLNSTISNNSTIVSESIHDLYLGYIGSLVDVSALTLLLYATVLAIPQELEYIWFSPRPFSIPNILYACTRYGSLITQALTFWGDFVPLGSLCNSLNDVSNALVVLPYAGVQGLLTIRAYSLCQTNRVLTAALAFFFMVGLILYIYASSLMALGGCEGSPDTVDFIVSTSINICVIVTDLLAILVCLWKVWSTWKVKREMSIQCSNDLVTILFRQAVCRFCFMIVVTVTITILNCVTNNLIIDIMNSIQHSLSAIILADFTLDIRQQNSAAIHANMTLPTLRLQSVANYVHQSILVEMGDNEHEHTREDGRRNDDSSTTPDFENHSIQESA